MLPVLAHNFHTKLIQTRHFIAQHETQRQAGFVQILTLFVLFPVAFAKINTLEDDCVVSVDVQFFLVDVVGCTGVLALETAKRVFLGQEDVECMCVCHGVRVCVNS